MSRVDAILSLQADLKDPVLPLSVIRAIQLVQESLAKSAEAPMAPGGWKRVDWRGPKPANQKFRGPGSGPVYASGGAGSGPSPPSTAPHVKYVSRFKKTGEADDAVLMLIQDKLNKFSPKNYKEILDFLCQILDSGIPTASIGCVPRLQLRVEELAASHSHTDSRGLSSMPRVGREEHIDDDRKIVLKYAQR